MAEAADPGIPRLPDGKPNLAAPAPRTADGKPDLSGLWQNDGGDRLYNNITVDMQPGDVAPWADAIYQNRRLEFGKDSMETLCLPMGPAYLTTRYRMNRIVQTPALVAFLYEDGRIARSGWTDAPSRPIRIPPGWATRWGDGRATCWWWRATAIRSARGSTSTAIPTPSSCVSPSAIRARSSAVST